MSTERKCPHCAGDLSKYEDPLAVKMLARSEARADELSTKLKFVCQALGKYLTKEEYAALERLIGEGWAG